MINNLFLLEKVKKYVENKLEGKRYEWLVDDWSKDKEFYKESGIEWGDWDLKYGKLEIKIGRERFVVGRFGKSVWRVGNGGEGFKYGKKFINNLENNENFIRDMEVNLFNYI